MRMKTVQIRLAPAQLESIDQQVKAGRYQSRSDAIRDYIRKAEFFEGLAEFRTLVQASGLTEAELLTELRAGKGL
jgi:Arc/MetJ-type ribon-helix-helix transcriptional regulator